MSCGLAAISGCQLWLDVDTPQCSSNSTCVELLGEGAICESGACQRQEPSADAGPELPTRWACIREPRKDFIPNPGKIISLRMDVVDIADTTHVPEGLVAKACTSGDFDCRMPVADNVRPGSDQFLEFSLPYGFEGFVRVEAPNYVPGISYDNRPYTESLTTSGPALVKPDILDSITQFSGEQRDPSAGLVFLEVRDCLDGAGEGVSFENLGDKGPFYFQGVLPSRDLTATTISNQLGAGREPRAVGGFTNVKNGFTTFKAKLEATGDPVSSVTVQVRAGEITYVRMRAGY